MGATIGQILSNAIGVAISPIPIIAVILVLFSKNARVGSVAFMVGWFVGLTAIEAVVVFTGPSSSEGTKADGAGVLKILIGALFLYLAWRQWQQRPKPGQPGHLPGWMEALDDASVGKLFGLGALLGAVNPKNLGLSLAAGTTISSAGLSTGQDVIVIAVFVLIASVSIYVPVLTYLFAESAAKPVLDSMKSWLTDNNATVMAVLFTILGVDTLGQGLTALL